MRDLISLLHPALVPPPFGAKRPHAALALLLTATALGCGSEKEDRSDGGVGVESVPSATTSTTSEGSGTSVMPSVTPMPSGLPTTSAIPTAPGASTTGTATSTAPNTDPSTPDVTDPESSATTTPDDPQTDTDDSSESDTDTEGEGGGNDLGTSDGDAAAGGGGEPNPPDLSNDAMPWFSFFTTSLDGLLSLAPDPENGFGGDFGGLEGADEICATLARQSNPTDAKVWRAFLSTGGFDGNPPVDAIDRIGEGPWYDYNGRLLAEDLAGLIPGEDGRPNGDPQLTEMFTDEYGEVIKPSDDIDNHDTLTGSGEDGRLFVEDDAGELATCNDWTDNTLRDENVSEGGGGPGGGGSRGRVPVGHSWPRSDSNGRNWSHEHNVNGCEPGVFIGVGGGAPSDNFTVGGGGGYGAFYCFALDAVAP